MTRESERPEQPAKSGLSDLRRMAGTVLTTLAPAAGLVVLFAVFSFTTTGFLTRDNLITVGVQIAVVAILAIGQTFVIVAGGIDLSVGSVLALAGMVTALLLLRDYPPSLAIAAGIGIGALCGLVNGVLVTWARLPPFIVTLGMMGICRGAAQIPTQAQATDVLPEVFTRLGHERILYDLLPFPILVLLVLAAIAHFVLRYTRMGRYCYAMGSNIEAARLSGVNVRVYMTAVFVICGALSGLAGVVGSARLSIGDPTAGMGYELDAIAAVVIGGASLMGGIGTIAGTMIGALIMAILRNGCDLNNIEPYWQAVVIGTVIIVAVLVDRIRHREG